jgi:hypothetical protein
LIAAIILIAVTLVGGLIFFYLCSFNLSGAPGYPLKLQVSPPGYPIFGELWKITVFKPSTSLDSNVSYYLPAKNAKIVIKALNKTGEIIEYHLFANDEGVAFFEYREQYGEVSFQAFLDGYAPSNEEKLGSSYAPRSELDWLFAFSIVSTGFVSSALIAKRIRSKQGKRLTQIWNVVLLGITGVSAVILIFSAYALLFRITSGGF